MSALRYTSTALADAVTAASSLANSQEDIAALHRCKITGSTSLTDVQLLSRLLRESGAAATGSDGGPWVHELMRGATAQLPRRVDKPAPHPELEPRLKKLREIQEDRDYAAMIGSAMSDENSNARDGAEMNTFRSQLGVGLNLIVSMGTMFIVGAYAGGTEEEPYGARAMVCGILLMILTLAIEMTLFLIGAIRVDGIVDKREKAAKIRGVSDRTKLNAHDFSKKK